MSLLLLRSANGIGGPGGGGGQGSRGWGSGVVGRGEESRG